MRIKAAQALHRRRLLDMGPVQNLRGFLLSRTSLGSLIVAAPAVPEAEIRRPPVKHLQGQEITAFWLDESGDIPPEAFAGVHEAQSVPGLMAGPDGADAPEAH